MKRSALIWTAGLLLMATLAGCVVVPAGGYHSGYYGGEYHHHRYDHDRY